MPETTPQTRVQGCGASRPQRKRPTVATGVQFVSAALLRCTQPTEQPRPYTAARNLPPPQQHPTQRSDALSPSASRAPRGCPDRTGGGNNWHISTIREYCQSKHCMNYEIVKMGPNLCDVLTTHLGGWVPRVTLYCSGQGTDFTMRLHQRLHMRLLVRT